MLKNYNQSETLDQRGNTPEVHAKSPKFYNWVPSLIIKIFKLIQVAPDETSISM
jgi:hypothetical protein